MDAPFLHPRKRLNWLGAVPVALGSCTGCRRRVRACRFAGAEIDEVPSAPRWPWGSQGAFPLRFQPSSATSRLVAEELLWRSPPSPAGHAGVREAVNLFDLTAVSTCRQGRVWTGITYRDPSQTLTDAAVDAHAEVVKMAIAALGGAVHRVP